MFGSIFSTLMNNSNNQTSYLPNRRFFFHSILAFTSKQWYRFIVWTPMKYQDFSSDENLVSSKETILTFTLWRFHCLIFLDKLFTYFKGQWRIVLIKCFMPYFMPYCYNILLFNWIRNSSCGIEEWRQMMCVKGSSFPWNEIRSEVMKGKLTTF